MIWYLLKAIFSPILTVSSVQACVIVSPVDNFNSTAFSISFSPDSKRVKPISSTNPKKASLAPTKSV
jgi:hypothetical protein